MKTMKKVEVQPHQWKVEPNKMKNTLPVGLLAGLLVLTTGLLAENVIPAGTILPLQLNTSPNSRKTKPGQVITGRIMQNFPLPSGARIRAGSKAIGRVLDVIEASEGGGAKLSLQFDTLKFSKRRIPVTTSLRALASMMDVEDAQIPKTGPDHGTPENRWTTVEIGGDVVCRGGGPVASGLRVVGTPTANGLLVRIASNSGTKCWGDLGGNDLPQALWLFSADACGTYGFADSTIAHAGRSNPVGQITLAPEKRNFDIRSGSGLLLRVK
jgi:hypothetical protein